MLNLPLNFREGGEVGPALGAARLAALALNPDIPAATLCPQPPLVSAHQPDIARHAQLSPRFLKFKQLYEALKPHF